MLKKNNLKYFYLISIIFLNSTTALDFNKVVIWGHKLHTHTHSYIHFAYYKTFQHLGYKTYWFDDNDNVSNFDFSKSLFITEGQVDRKIPMRQDCYYILHHCDKNRYSDLKKNQRAISMYVFYTTEFHEYPTKIDNYVYGDFDLGKICMPWATDLLPHEIELNKQKIKNIKKTNKVYWIGTVGGGWAGNMNELSPFMKACNENGIGFQQVINISTEKNIELIQQSYMSPAIVGTWQEKNGYIPCRIFKNISYGQMGITNSQTVYEFFDKKLIFNKDTYQLFYDAKNRLKNIKLEEIYELMDLVKEKHTYINRINTLTKFFDDYIKFHQNEK